MDDEYVRNGVAQIFMGVEPLAGMRKVAITKRRTKIYWAKYIKEMLDVHYTNADMVVGDGQFKYAQYFVII